MIYLVVRGVCSPAVVAEVLLGWSHPPGVGAILTGRKAGFPDVKSRYSTGQTILYSGPSIIRTHLAKVVGKPCPISEKSG